MFKTDIIKTYIFEPQYYEYIKKDYYGEFLEIFNNNILYLYINIYGTRYLKIKQIKQNYIIYIYLALNNSDNNKIFCTKIKNYDNTILDIIKDGFYDGCYKLNYDFRINNNTITKKIDKDIYIIYYHKKNIIKDGYYKVIRRHKFYNSEKCYYKFYKTYYINYYIIINFDIDNYYNNTSQNCMYKWNTIFCNYSRNFMLFI